MDGDAYRATTYGPSHGLPPFALALGVGGGSLTISNTCRPERRDDVQRQDAPVTHQNGPGERESSGIQLGLPHSLFLHVLSRGMPTQINPKEPTRLL